LPSGLRMPRALRLHVPGAMYHVTLRGNHRQNIFFSPADRQLMGKHKGDRSIFLSSSAAI
jgi:REP element-mobilizing transposase RayT